jgi:hypothetical protein
VFLRKLVSTDIMQLVAPHWMRRLVGQTPKGRARKLTAHQLKLKRRAHARKMEAARLKVWSGRLYPPQTGHRRPEWSSALPGRWSTLNQAPEVQ